VRQIGDSVWLAVLTLLIMRFVITSGTGIREIVDQRNDARSTYQRVMDLVSMRRPNIHVFNQDGHPLDLNKLRRISDEEIVRTKSSR
jgi:hypothetical protein